MWVKADGRQALQNPYFNAVTPGYFTTFGTSVLLRRSFDAQDDATSARVIVVNQTLVREIFPGVDPLGKQVLLGLQGDIPFEIVGVVPDAKYYSLREAALPQVYLPYLHSRNPPEVLALEVRLSAVAKSDSGRLIAAVQSELGPINKYATVTVTTLDAQLDDSLQQERLMTILSSGFGLLALALAAVGLSGLLTYTVGRRIKEIGIRVALGAQRRDVIWMVMRENLALVSIGVAIGVLTTLLAIRLASSVTAEMLFGIKATDPVTIVIAAVVTIGAALIAGYIPARRAAKVDPMVALRHE